MSRPLRIQYPDAWYHVMNRGRHGEKIFATADKGLRNRIQNLAEKITKSQRQTPLWAAKGG
jgi:hypothetical protein